MNTNLKISDWLMTPAWYVDELELPLHILHLAEDEVSHVANGHHPAAHGHAVGALGKPGRLGQAVGGLEPVRVGIDPVLLYTSIPDVAIHIS